jgi:hypothetical protein
VSLALVGCILEHQEIKQSQSLGFATASAPQNTFVYWAVKILGIVIFGILL